MPVLKKLLKYITVASITTSTGWVCHQIYSTKNILNNALDISVLSVDEIKQIEGNDTDDNVIVIPPLNQDSSLSYTYDMIKLNVAKRLLKLSTNDKQFIRLGAVQSLSKMNLQDWQYELLASLMDAETAVGLARSKDINLKFFKDAPNCTICKSHDELVEKMKELLTKLYTNSNHPCLGYFISETFAEFHEHSHHDQDTATIELKKYIQSVRDTLSLSLESLLHHSSLDKYGRDIVEYDGLPLLMEIYQQYKGTCNIEALLCSIIANLTYHYEIREELFKTGWLKVLAKWAKEEADLKIALPTAKALANLDRDGDATFRSRVYLLHPTYRSTGTFDADVVFVHGLLGGVFFTWRQRQNKCLSITPLGKGDQKNNSKAYPSCPKKFELQELPSDPMFRSFLEDLQQHFDECVFHDFEVVMEDLPVNSQGEKSDGPFTYPSHKFLPVNNEINPCYTYCWPKDWLSEDFKNLRIIGINYDTNISMWAPICPSEHVKTLEQRSDELVKQLRDAGIGQRPIIWICHSMGGLLVKKVLVKSFHSENKRTKNISLNTKAVVFYSTPHFGSSLAKLNPAIALLFWPSTEVKELQENCPRLLQIHQDFMDLIEHVPMKVLSFVETKPTVISAMKFGFLLVDPVSGNPGIGEYYEIPTDHLQICKPSSKCSFLYQKVFQLIDNVIYNGNTNM